MDDDSGTAQRTEVILEGSISVVFQLNWAAVFDERMRSARVVSENGQQEGQTCSGQGAAMPCQRGCHKLKMSIKWTKGQSVQNRRVSGSDMQQL
mmetsp:Transcript_36375/g.65079  ORF Transcript_36375/g.65079 Transcript_36375/m.65079 type:complete len:94 (+) Transcript_36375:260-541(+)